MRRTDWLEHADRVSRVVGELACAQSHSQGSYGIGVPPAVQLATCYSPCLLVHSFARSFARVQFNLIDEVAAGNVEAGVYWAEKQLWLEEPEPLLSYADCRFNVRARSRSRTRALLHCVAHYCPGTHRSSNSSSSPSRCAFASISSRSIWLPTTTTRCSSYSKLHATRSLSRKTPSRPMRSSSIIWLMCVLWRLHLALIVPRSRALHALVVGFQASARHLGRFHNAT